MTDTSGQEDYTPWEVIDRDIDSYNRAGGSSLDHLTSAERSSVPTKLIGHNRAEIEEWANAIAARSFLKGAIYAQNSVKGMIVRTVDTDPTPEPPRLAEMDRRAIQLDEEG